MKLLILLNFICILEAKRRLYLPDVCEGYLDCTNQLEKFREKCQNSENKTRITSSEFCTEELKDDFDFFEKKVGENRQEVNECIRNTASIKSHYKYGKEKFKFCYPYVKEKLELSSSDCQLNIMIMNNRCSALRQCCNPAIYCEQAGVYSQSGRIVQGLQEEISIKLADCNQRIQQKDSRSEVSNDLDSYEFINEQPIDFCKKYLQCRKNGLEIKTICSVLMKTAQNGSEYSWSPSYNRLSKPLDDKDDFCKATFASDYSDLMVKREKAEKYLDECVPIANVTRENSEKQQPCQPNLIAKDLIDTSILSSSNCPYYIVQQRTQCSLLRDCCVQVDICERNAMYGVLADDYLLSYTELKSKMDNCYHS